MPGQHPADRKSSDSRKVRKMGLLQAFRVHLKTKLHGKAVKIETKCVVKWEKRNSRELQRGFRVVAKRLPCRNFGLR